MNVGRFVNFLTLHCFKRVNSRDVWHSSEVVKTAELVLFLIGGE